MNEIGLLVIAVLGLVVAALASVAWRIRRAERQRSAARVATLAADIREADRFRAPAVVALRAESKVQRIAARTLEVDAWPARETGSTPELFRFHQPRGSQSRLGSVLAVGLCALVVALALLVATGRGVGPAADSRAPVPSAPGSPGSAAIELVALDQKRDGDRLTVRGAVRNPPAGKQFDHLVAVVTFFGRDGKALGSGRAPMQPQTMRPGEESAFAVTIARGPEVARYRVRFHVDERVVAHLDRRSSNPESSSRQP